MPRARRYGAGLAAAPRARHSACDQVAKDMAAAKVLAFRAPEETAPEETAPEETEADSDLREPGEPDSAETVDLDAASTGMAMLLRLTLHAMRGGGGTSFAGVKRSKPR